MTITFLSKIPETAALLGVGFALILGGVILRRALALFEGGLPAANQSPEPKEHPLK